MKNKQLAIMLAEIRAKDTSMSLMEAIVELCDVQNLEIESVASVIRQSQKLKEELHGEALALKLVK